MEKTGTFGGSWISTLPYEAILMGRLFRSTGTARNENIHTGLSGGSQPQIDRRSLVACPMEGKTEHWTSQLTNRYWALVKCQALCQSLWPSPAMNSLVNSKGKTKHVRSCKSSGEQKLMPSVFFILANLFAPISRTTSSLMLTSPEPWCTLNSLFLPSFLLPSNEEFLSI